MMNTLHDDDELIPMEDATPVIPEDEYDAVVESVRKVKSYRRPTAEFTFKIVTLGAQYGLRLKGWCPLPQRKLERSPAGSKLSSWRMVLASFTGGSPSKVTLGAFKQYWFRVSVETVKQNSRQQSRAEGAHYSKVADIRLVVGKISELPSVDKESRHSQTSSADEVPLVRQEDTDA